MPTFRVTAKGTTTIMHASEIRKLHAVRGMILSLSRNQPTVSEYDACVTSMGPVCDLWPLPKENANDKPSK